MNKKIEAVLIKTLEEAKRQLAMQAQYQQEFAELTKQISEMTERKTQLVALYNSIDANALQQTITDINEILSMSQELKEEAVCKNED